MAFAGALSTSELACRQGKLVQYGTVPLMIALVSRRESSLRADGLDFALALLSGGPRVVQDAVLHQLADPHFRRLFHESIHLQLASAIAKIEPRRARTRTEALNAEREQAAAFEAEASTEHSRQPRGRGSQGRSGKFFFLFEGSASARSPAATAAPAAGGYSAGVLRHLRSTQAASAGQRGGLLGTSPNQTKPKPKPNYPLGASASRLVSAGFSEASGASSPLKGSRRRLLRPRSRAVFDETSRNLSSWLDAPPSSSRTADDPLAEKTVRLLQLLVENHHNGLQDLMSAAAVDPHVDSHGPTILTQVFLLLKEMAPSIDVNFASLAARCLEALAELVQGQVSLTSARVLLTELKALPYIEACLTCVIDEAHPSARAQSPHDTVALVAGLRAAAATLLLALVEGGEAHSRQALQLMRRELTLTPTLVKSAASPEGVVASTSAAGGLSGASEAASRGGGGSGGGGGGGNGSGGSSSSLEASGSAVWEDVPLRRTLERMIAHETHHRYRVSPDPSGDAAESRRAIFQLYILMSRLVEDDGSDTSACQRAEHVLRVNKLPPGSAWLQRSICSVEIKNKADELERVYFPIPDICRDLTKETKEYFDQTVNIQSLPAKLAGLLDQSAQFQAEMEHQASLKQWAVLRPCLKLYPLLKPLLFLLAVAMNIVLVAHFESTDYWSDSMHGAMRSSSYHGLLHAGIEARAGMSSAWVVLGICILANSVFLVVFYLLQYAKLQARSAYVRLRGEVDEWVRLRSDTRQGGGAGAGRVKASPATQMRASMMQAMCWPVANLAPLCSLTLIAYVLYVGAAVCGLLLHPFFFAIHLLDLVNFSPALQTVFRALTKNGAALLLVATFVLVVTFIYGVIAMAFFQADYVDNETQCYDLISCWVTMTYVLRRGDLTEAALARPAYDPLYYWQLFFSFSYWLLVVTIFLNLLFGIIVDTFGELRSAASERDAHAANICFICGIERTTFDRNGVNYREHIAREHDKWRYLYLLVHLRLTPSTEYSGWESFIADKLPENRSDGNRADFSWFPMHRALSLRHLQEREDAEKAAEQQQLLTIASRQQKMVEVGEASARRSEERLANITSMLGEMQRVAADAQRGQKQMAEAQSKLLERQEALELRVDTALRQLQDDEAASPE